MIGKWISWHYMRISSAFILLFNLQVKADLADPTSKEEINNQVEQLNANEPTPHEKSMGAKYKHYDAPMGGIQRMNAYFWSLLVLSAIGYGFWRAIGAPAEYTENRGVDCPSGSGFWDCLGIYVDRFSNVPLLFLMGLILVFVVTAAVYEMMRNKGKKVTEEDYNKGKKWLKLLDEESRTLTPPWLFFILIAFLLLEAAAITMIASSFVADFSRTTELWVGGFVGIVCVIVLGWLVHQAGAQLYCNKKRKDLNRLPDEIKADIKKESQTFDSTGRSEYYYLIVSIVVVLGLVTLAFMQRYNLNMAILQDEVTVATESSLFGDDLPPEITTIENENQQEIASHATNQKEQGLIAALAVLSIIFIMVNFFGVWIGNHYCLYGDKSKKSYTDKQKYEKWTKSAEEAQREQDEDREKLYSVANIFFGKYFQNLLNEARRVTEYADLREALSTRKAWSLERHEKYKESEKHKESKGTPG